MKLDGKRAFVTGAANGIGRAIVQAFLSEGAYVFAMDRDAAGLHQFERDLAHERLKTGFGDLASKADITRLAEEAAEAFGSIDTLVNNAGIFDDYVPVLDQTQETWDRILSVNVTSHFQLAQALLPSMIAQGSGAIVSISSPAGQVAGGGGIAYTASKHAVIGLARQLALEVGPKGVRVNVICPGITATPLLLEAHRNDRDGRIDGLTGRTAAGRMGTPDEIARATVFLASNDASFMFGSVVNVDGGYTLI